MPPTAGTAAGRSGRKDKQHKSAPTTPDKRKQPGYWLGILYLVFVVVREVGWEVRRQNREKHEQEDKEE